MHRLIVLVALLLSGPVFAQSAVEARLAALQADPVARQAAIDAGRKASFFCANCHGEQGIAKTDDVPNLAGQHPTYLLEQIRKFGSGERRDPFMQGLIKVLKDDERVQIALFYANNPVPPGKADATQVARGKLMFDKLCARCHGDQAHGSALYPRLAGQKQTYLQTSITHYRDGTGVRNNPLMRIATAPLKNEDVVAIAHYLSQLP